MLTSPLRALCICAVFGCFGVSAAHGATLLSDDFTGAKGTAPNTATWSTYLAAGAALGNAGSVTQDGSGNLFATVGAYNTASYQRMASAITNATDFNPFTTTLDIQLNGVVIGGSGGTKYANTNPVTGYLLLGRSNDGQDDTYVPGGMAAGLGLFLQKNTTDTGDLYDLMVSEYSTSGSSNTLDITGTPTGLDLKVDGASETITITLTGATFTSSGDSTLTQSLSGGLTEASLKDGGSLDSRIALGAWNDGAVYRGSSLKVDSIMVTTSNPVPEPATLALLGLGGLAMVTRRRHA